jgi:hypothetical protein
MADIEATVTLKIQRKSGPEIADPKHVAAWLVADGYAFEGEYAGFTFAVCSRCPDPDLCDHRDADSDYAAMIMTVDSAEVDD